MNCIKESVEALVQEALLETEAGHDWRTSHEDRSVMTRAIVINVLHQDHFPPKEIANLLNLKQPVVSKWIRRFEDYQDKNACFQSAYYYVDLSHKNYKKRTCNGLFTDSPPLNERDSNFAIEILTQKIMTLIEMINQNPDKFQETLQESLRLMSNLVEKLREEPEVEKFMSAEFVLLNGAHFNADNVKSFVDPMTHRNAEGNQVEGELITIEEVKERLPEEFLEVNLWDAYVGINEMLHKLARTSLERDQIIEVAIEYWLRDERYEQPSEKVWKTLNR